MERHEQGMPRPLAAAAIRLNWTHAQMAIVNALGNIYWRAGALDDAVRAFQTVQGLARQCNSPIHEADALNNAGLIYWKQGRYDEALEAFHASLSPRHQTHDRFGLCGALLNMGIIQEQRGQVAAARRSYDNALTLANKTGFAQALAAVESNLSNLQRRLGMGAEALDHSMRAIEFSRQAADPYYESIAEENAGLALAALDRPAEAREHLTRALRLADERGMAERALSVRLQLLQLRPPSEQDMATAVSEVETIVHTVQQNGYKDLIPRALRIKARVMMAAAPPSANAHEDSAPAECLRQALDSAQQRGNLFEELECWRALRLYHEGANQPVQARAAGEQISRITLRLRRGDMEPARRPDSADARLEGAIGTPPPK